MQLNPDRSISLVKLGLRKHSKVKIPGNWLHSRQMAWIIRHGSLQRNIMTERGLWLKPSVCREFPGELEKIRVWFRDYKKPDGKPENKFGFDDQYKNREYTLEVVKETHELYNNLKSGKRENSEGLALS